MKVIRSKSCTTLGTFSQSGIIATADALRAEDVEAFGKNCVLLSSGTAGTVQLSLAEGKLKYVQKIK